MRDRDQAQREEPPEAPPPGSHQPRPLDTDCSLQSWPEPPPTPQAQGEPARPAQHPLCWVPLKVRRSSSSRSVSLAPPPGSLPGRSCRLEWVRSLACPSPSAAAEPPLSPSRAGPPPGPGHHCGPRRGGRQREQEGRGSQAPPPFPGEDTGQLAPRPGGRARV